MAEDDSWREFQKAVSFNRASCGLVESEVLGGTPQEFGIAGRLGCGEQEYPSGGCWEPRYPSQETCFNPTRNWDRRWPRQCESPCELGRRQTTRKLKQGKRVAVCFRKNSLKNLTVKRIWKGQAQEGASGGHIETIDGQAWQPVEIAGDGSSAKQECDGFRGQSTSRDSERLSRALVEPLCIVNDAQDRSGDSQLGYQAKEREPYDQSVGRRAGDLTKRHAEVFALSSW
jgi:hypothetical protein